MKKILIPLSISILIIALVGWLMVSGSSSDTSGNTGNSELAQEDTKQAEEEAAAARKKAADKVKAAETAAAAGEQEEAAIVTGPKLHGVVTDLEGNPVRGARVMLRVSSTWEGMEDADRYTMFRQRVLGKESVPVRGPASHRTQTDGSGQYAFALSAIKKGRYDILASAEGFAPGDQRWQWSRETSRVDFQLGVGEIIRGIVRSPAGAPVEGAVVMASKSDNRGWGRFGPGGGRGGAVDETVTNADGLFTLNVYAGEFDIRGNKSGFSEGDLGSVPSGSADVELLLGKGRGVSGLVVDAGSNPIGGVKLSLFESRSAWGGGRGRGGPPRAITRLFSTPLATSESAADGTFLFSDMEDGNFRIMAEKDTFVTTEVNGELEEEAESAEISISMASGRVIAGMVKTPDGTPMAGAFVVIAREERREGGDERGRGRGGRGGRGDERGGRGDREGNEEEAKEKTPEELEREQRREEERQREPVSVYRSSLALETEPDGSFVADTLEKGTYTLSVQGEFFVPHRVREIDLDEKERADLDIVVDPGLQLKGEVVSSTDGKPVAGANAVLRWRDDRRVIPIGPKGEFTIGGLVAGKIGELQVDAQGFSMLHVDDIELKPQPAIQEVKVQLVPTGMISGVVVDGSGTPIPRARIRVYDAVEELEKIEGEAEGDRRRREDDRRRQERNRGRRMVDTRSNAEGKFTLKEVNPGHLRLRAEHSAYKDLRSEAFDLEPGEHADDFTLELVTGGRLLVMVKDSGGVPLPGVRVVTRFNPPEAEEEEGDERRGRGPGGRGRGGERDRYDLRTTNREGLAIFGGIDGGNYRVSVNQGGYQPFIAFTDVIENKDTPFNITLLPENVITGIVTDLVGNPIEGARIRVGKEREDGEREGSEARSAADGSFQVGNLGVGAYTVRAERRGYVEQAFEEVAVNSNIKIELVALGEIVGQVLSVQTQLPVPEYFLVVRPRREAGQPEREDENEGRGGRGERGGRGRGRDEEREGGNKVKRVKDPEGRFEVDDLAPGSYTVEVIASGYTGQRVEAEVASGPAQKEIVISLEEGLSVTGEVLDRSGQPVAGASIFLLARESAAGAEPRGGRERERGRGGAGDSRDQLRERIQQARESGRGGRGGSGRERQDDKTQKEAAALLAGVGGDEQNSIESDDDGYFQMKEVPEGTYNLLVHHDAFLPYVARVSVREDRGIRPETVRLDPGETVTGKVSYEEGRAAAAGVTLIFTDQQGLNKLVRTDDRGRYSATGFMTGTYGVRVRAGNSNIPPQTFNVSRGANKFDYEISAGAAAAGKK